MKAVVLLSGGQDSTTSLFWAKKHFGEIEALSISYGQRHEVELSAAARIAEIAGANHRILKMGVLSAIGDSDLVREGTEIKGSSGYDDAEAPNGLPTSFVPGRNLLFLSVAAAVAVKLGARDIVTGVCQTDFSGYPDCRRSFVDSLETTISLAMPSGCGPFNIHTPLMSMTKAETVRLARALGDDCWEALGESVTCYEGRRPACGECPACVLRIRGFEEAGEVDPSGV